LILGTTDCIYSSGNNTVLPETFPHPLVIRIWTWVIHAAYETQVYLGMKSGKIQAGFTIVV